MDCLICYKVFIKEIEFQDCQPKDWASIISKLFQFPQNPEVGGHLEDLAICRGCHGKLEVVEKLVTQLEKIQRKVDVAKTRIQNEMVKSNKLCEVQAQALSANRMSKSSVDRCALLKAIENVGEKAKESPIPSNVVFSVGEIKREVFEEEVFTTSGMDQESVIFPNFEVFSGEIKGEAFEKEMSGMDQEMYSAQEDPDFDPGSSFEDTDASDSELKARLWPHKCPHCSRGFSDKRGLKTHLGSETPSECMTCKETFPTLGCLKEHQFLVHGSGDYAKLEAKRLKCFAEKKKGFQCQFCSRTFKRKYVLTHHLETHSAGYTPRFSCPEDGCEKRFTLKESLKRHIKNFHEKSETTSPKKVKGKSFRRFRVGAFKCRILSTCRRVFKSMNSRNFHEETHMKKNNLRILYFSYN